MLPLSGDIKNMMIPQLFENLRAGKKTGTAVFTTIQAIKKVYFKEGDVIFASSNLDDDRLGEFLLRTGKITQVQYDVSAEILRKTGKRQGTILVDMGFISPPDLVESVKLQVKHIVLSLFTILEGSYTFNDGLLPLSDIIPLQMSTGNLILEGLAQLDWQVVRKSLPSLKTVLRPSTDPSVLFQNAQLTQDQKSVLSLIDGKRSIEELCSLSGIGDFNALKAVYMLLAIQMVETGKIKTEEEMSFARAVVHAAVEKEEQETAAEPASRQMIERAYEEMSVQDHYQVLGIDRTARIQDLKKAYFRLAKVYHPDRHFEPEMQDMKEKLEALFARIHEAYEALGNEAQRKQYDLHLTKVVRTRKTGAATVSTGLDRIEKSRTAAAQFENGMKEYKVKNFWSALESFAWACRLDPAKSKYFYHHGLALAHMPRRRHEAEESFQKAIELEPTNADYHYELGNVYLSNGLKMRALAVFQQALELDPDSDKIKKAVLAAGGEVKE